MKETIMEEGMSDFTQSSFKRLDDFVSWGADSQAPFFVLAKELIPSVNKVYGRPVIGFDEDRNTISFKWTQMFWRIKNDDAVRVVLEHEGGNEVHVFSKADMIDFINNHNCIPKGLPPAQNMSEFSVADVSNDVVDIVNVDIVNDNEATVPVQKWATTDDQSFSRDEVEKMYGLEKFSQQQRKIIHERKQSSTNGSLTSGSLTKETPYGDSWTSGKAFGTVQSGDIKDSDDTGLLAHHLKSVDLSLQVEEIQVKEQVEEEQLSFFMMHDLYAEKPTDWEPIFHEDFRRFRDHLRDAIVRKSSSEAVEALKILIRNLKDDRICNGVAPIALAWLGFPAVRVLLKFLFNFRGMLEKLSSNGQFSKIVRQNLLWFASNLDDAPAGWKTQPFQSIYIIVRNDK
jgi:hypothetical protein